jgi:hypothetical protein
MTRHVGVVYRRRLVMWRGSEIRDDSDTNMRCVARKLRNGR